MIAPANLFEQINRNRRRSWILIALVVLLLVIVGFLIGNAYGNPVFGTLAAVAISVAVALISYYSGDRVVLGLMGAAPADPVEYRILQNVVEEMAIAAGLPTPKVYVIRSAASNAFATGREPGRASIAVTTGLLEILNREELQGVIGHEMSHIRQYDTRYAVLMAVLVGAVVILCDSFWRSLRWGGLRSGGRSRKGVQIAVPIFVLAMFLSVIAPLFARIIQFAMSRTREFLADSGGAELTRNPIGLARALQKISADPDPLDVANRGTQHLFIVNPLNTYSGSTWAVRLFSTHPPIKERVRILNELAHVYPSTKEKTAAGNHIS
jgi:heat shock protein HtpX